MSDQPLIKRRLKITDAAIMFGLTRREVEGLIKRGTLAYFQLPGGRRTVDPDELEAIIAKGQSGIKSTES